ncbi:DUF642 domain-containing protein [Glaciimonas sp. Gout2]|uniref:DUF642 domain-containing protein n=1 Tax=unclassified Glaciimonas TaxID=2644401 RepID=UPI002B234296|nr:MULTISPECIES: DUF642 domain-containing protein [unclassified Glaciimonas]MEB0012039.1 DUF642 domain-containing protein [Glaciimonas sp. Cout2]MEB0084045.1 DUF642 domain-containing protein [Glaciimonas sp. Gout2]
MKTGLLIKISALVLLAAAGSANATAQLVTNGGFENGQSGWNFNGNVKVTSGNVYAQYGWTDANYPNGNVALFGAGDMAGGSIKQDLITVAGQTYALSFDYGAITGGGRPQNLNVSVNDISGPSIFTSQYTAYGTGSLAQLMTAYAFDFTAISNETVINFADANIANGNSIDATLDNVSVTPTAVPEPETYPLLLTGLVLMGLTLRTRQRK